MVIRLSRKSMQWSDNTAVIGLSNKALIQHVIKSTYKKAAGTRDIGI